MFAGEPGMDVSLQVYSNHSLFLIHDSLFLIPYHSSFVQTMQSSVPYTFFKVPFIGKKRIWWGGMGGEGMENLRELTYQPPASSQTFDIHSMVRSVVG